MSCKRNLRSSSRNSNYVQVLFALFLAVISLISVILAENPEFENVSEFEIRQNPMSINTLQKLFLDALSGKSVGPSANPTVDPKYELNRTTVAYINSAIPFKAIFQVGLPGFAEAGTAAMLMLTEIDDIYVIIVRAARLRPLINLDVWTRAVFESTFFSSTAILGKPTLIELQPYRCLPRPVIDTAIAQAGQPGKKCPIADESYGVINGVENEVWYFREDIETNVQHWYWHLAYPLRVDPRGRPDRRGELFYYLHQAELARYNAERLGNNLPLVTPYVVTPKNVIQEKYYPYISDTYSELYWPGRPANQAIDYNGNMGENIPAYLEAVYASIDDKTLINETGESISISNIKGIDLLVDVVESNAYSVNSAIYGGIHNDGHLIISRLGNATDSFWGAMAELSTSMRDPSFYRWHTFINDIFVRHKLLLPPYALNTGEFPLIWSGVEVRALSVDAGLGTPSNRLETFWSYKKNDISRIIHLLRNESSSDQGPISVCSKQLNHRNFNYHITIISTVSSKATVRIFMAPRFDVGGKKLFGLELQRQLFFATDTFTTKLNLGLNILKRRSKDSTFTRQSSKSFSDIEQELARNRLQKPQCGCGHPHHLLLPRGTKAGMVFDLFVMVTNGEEDSEENLGDQSRNVCTQPYHWCGRPGQVYPDKRPMGYPFDRLPPSTAPGRRVNNLEKYVSLIPNSKTVQVVITHKDD